MAWTKHFKYVGKNQLPAGIQNSSAKTVNSSGRYNSYLPEVYIGSPQRIERYTKYEAMDMDSEVASSLNVYADFCTQRGDDQWDCFQIQYDRDPNESETKIISQALTQWCKINEFNKKIWHIFRNTLKYGDTFFVRDPETFKLYWIENKKVLSIIVNEAEGKLPEQYVIQNLELNLVAMSASNLTDTEQAKQMISNNTQPNNILQFNKTTQSTKKSMTVSVDAKHVCHASLSSGMDGNWPFGTSILEGVFKNFQQKQLLEEAILIYRIQRAPERRVFYVDVGDMPPHKAMAHVERLKNEIHQKRIPNRSGGGTNIVDAAYNPISMMDDIFISQTTDGRGSKVETLPGGDSLGQLDDLNHFNNLLKRGLGIPPSYLPGGGDDNQGSTFNDGKTGTAYMQEYRFSETCLRYQRQLIDTLDHEFKMYVKKLGINIDSSIFRLAFFPPQNFGKFRQMDVDTAQIAVFQPLADVPYLSKRFLLNRFLKLTPEEIEENQRLWMEENTESEDKSNLGLESVGINRSSDELEMAVDQQTNAPPTDSEESDLGTQ